MSLKHHLNGIDPSPHLNLLFLSGGGRRLELRRQFTPQLSSESEGEPPPLQVQDLFSIALFQQL